MTNKPQSTEHKNEIFGKKFIFYFYDQITKQNIGKIQISSDTTQHINNAKLYAYAKLYPFMDKSFTSEQAQELINKSPKKFYTVCKNYIYLTNTPPEALNTI